MLNFAEQTGSGAVIVVWSFLPERELRQYTIGGTSIHIVQQYPQHHQWRRRRMVPVLGDNGRLCVQQVYYQSDRKEAD